jgi:predicted AAA+ superfamily ATPase
MAFFKENKGKIITYDQEEVIKLPEGEIEIVPAWKFFSQEINY